MKDVFKIFDEIITNATEAKEQAEAFYNKGVKVSATRSRKALMDLKNLSSEARKQIQKDRG